ncbi:type II/IV secretion system protein [Candidatus Saccharibacteria bacterium]|nr:type II/IV secretion system protein [Candidatus Saccharibacteria bacterium]NCU40587.1 type II/IV secretion system protein [Candidatus Saccharibacteria bacterium]
MRLSDATVEQLLEKNNKVTSEQLENLKSIQKQNNRPLQDLAVKENIVTEKQLTEFYSKFANIPFVEINPKEIDKDTMMILPEKISRQYSAVVFKDDGKSKHLAMEDPDDMQAVDFIQKQIGADFVMYIATKENILQVLENFRDGVADEIADVVAIQEEVDTKEEVSEEDIAENSPIAKTVNLILEYAIRSNASDIHIEPREEFVQVRYRIDGVLNEANKLPRNIIAALVSRIKILSNLKIDERRVPQDGRFKVTVAGKKYALRVSTLPIAEGEKVVMRILDESNRALTLEELGYWGWSLEKFNSAIAQPYGMVLVTGPTGSGKSTSLYSALTIRNKPDVNISTVEDPIEYKLQGANQTQVNPTAGMTFIAGLRALLRQDPNIIMVGEIRDAETANLGVQAALTGHLVFSTLHTNNAATCLPRLLDMGIEPFLIASTVRAVVGQRLVRRLCKTCKEDYAPSKVDLDAITHMFNIKSASDMQRIHELDKKAAEQGIGSEISEKLSSTPSTITRLYRAHPEGCDECNHSGYKGRMGIYEVLDNSVPIQKLIVENATSNSIQDLAVKEGMMTMQIDGFIKALRGQTSIEEILRVTRE